VQDSGAKFLSTKISSIGRTDSPCGAGRNGWVGGLAGLLKNICFLGGIDLKIISFNKYTTIPTLPILSQTFNCHTGAAGQNRTEHIFCNF
jgi:hypothetical protein